MMFPRLHDIVEDILNERIKEAERKGIEEEEINKVIKWFCFVYISVELFSEKPLERRAQLNLFCFGKINLMLKWRKIDSVKKKRRKQNV